MSQSQELSLARLPGQSFDATPAKLRAELKNDPETLERFAAGLNGALDASEAFDVQAVANATATNVISAYWKFVKTSSLQSFISFCKKGDGIKKYPTTTRQFAFCYLVFLKATQQLFIKAVSERSESQSLTDDDQMFIVSSLSAKLAMPKELGSGIPVVSMADLVVLFARIAEVAPVVYKRDVGVFPTSAEVVQLMRHASVLRLIVSFMTNGREILYPLFAMLDGCDTPNLDEINRAFEPQYFEIREVQGVHSLHLKQSVIKEYRKKCGAEMGAVSKRAFGCPALYSGTLTEMFTWLLGGYEEWLKVRH